MSSQGIGRGGGNVQPRAGVVGQGGRKGRAQRQQVGTQRFGSGGRQVSHKRNASAQRNLPKQATLSSQGVVMIPLFGKEASEMRSNIEKPIIERVVSQPAGGAEVIKAANVMMDKVETLESSIHYSPTKKDMKKFLKQGNQILNELASLIDKTEPGSNLRTRLSKERQVLGKSLKKREDDLKDKQVSLKKFGAKLGKALRAFGEAVKDLFKKNDYGPFRIPGNW